VDAKARVAELIGSARGGLIDLSHRIHAHPEIAFEEERSAAWVAGSLSDGGFEVQTGAGDLPTAFVATAGTGPLTIAICAEYDALPEIGHACGHNVIAAAAVGAGIALAPLADDLGITVRVVGTPAEEGGGGKILLLERGVFDGAHAAMMVHPAPYERHEMPCLAVSSWNVAYSGRTAHASAFPEMGVNAADALTVAQVAIGLMRQHMRTTDRVHGIVIDGGEAPNIIPGYATGRWYVRSSTLAALEEWEPKVLRCFEAGALATGSTLELTPHCPPYSEFRTDAGMAAAYVRNAEALGRTFLDLEALGADPSRLAGSTDMANVSLAMPAIHPMLGIDSFPAVNHQPEFAAACVSDAADRAVADGATAMAWTVIDLATDEAERSRLLASAYHH